MDRVVFSVSRGSCTGSAFNRHAVFREPRDNRVITATFPAKYASLAEVVEAVTG